MTSSARPAGRPGNPVRAVYHPIPVAWLFLVAAPLGVVAVAGVMIVRAILVPDEPGWRAASLLWALVALAWVYRALSRTVVRAELTDTVLIATRESMLDPLMERRFQIERRGLYVYDRTR